MTDEQLSALLRLKRYEQPPPQYFETLLQRVHRRQRCELLRGRSGGSWSSACRSSSASTAWGTSRTQAAMTAALVGGLAVIGALVPGGSQAA
jgi:hypothetical protein